MTTMGPFQAEAQARAASRWAQVAAEWGADRAGDITSLNLADLTVTCEQAGVELGAYDRRVIEWLAGYEPATVAVIAGLISRAREAASQLTGQDGSEEAAP